MIQNPLKYTLQLLMMAMAPIAFCQESTVAWVQNLGGSSNEEGLSITPTKDGGLMTAGFSYSEDGILTSNEGWQDGWMIKTNSEGHIEWQKTIGSGGADVIEKVAEVSDGYIICGWSSSQDPMFVDSKGFEDGFIAKVNLQGDLLWIESFGGSSMDKLFDLEILDNGDIIAVGYALSEDIAFNNSVAKGMLDIWVIKLTSNGELVWQNSYGGSDDDFAYNITINTEGKLLIAGGSDSMDGQIGYTMGEWDCFLFQIDEDGNYEWGKTYGYGGNEIIEDVVLYNDYYYLVASSNSSERLDDNGDYDAWILQLDKSGNLIEEHSIGGSEKDIIHSAVATPNGIYITGESESNGSTDGWLIQLDGLGSILSSHLIGGSDYDLLNDISFRNNELFFSGSTHSSDGDMSHNFGESDALIGKLGSDESLNDLKIKVFPNPASDNITIVLDEIGIKSYKVYNTMGQLVLASNADNFFQEQISISDWPTGYYTVEVNTDNTILRKQFIKQ